MAIWWIFVGRAEMTQAAHHDPKLIFEAADIAAAAQAWQAHQFHENAPRCRKPLGEQAVLKRMGLHLVRVAPDDATPQFHFHDYAVAFVCLSFGELTLEYGAEIYTIKPIT